VIPLESLPALNAGLNTVSFVLLLSGYFFIRRRHVEAHRACMLGACAVSAVFLVSYLTYHFQVGSVRFTAQGWVRPLYFTILITHTVLAAAVVPLVLVTVVRAWKKKFEAHRAIARLTLPVWLYVSLTGVVVYLMLYQLFPPA
jgi:uncharacterized membrane protein YozB (DUF420 family)